MKRAPIILLLVTLLLLAGRIPASGFDLTGTWAGSSACTSFFAGAKIKFSDAPVIQITQVGDVIGLRADHGGGVVDLYTGRVIPDAKKPDEKGEVALIACGTDDVAGNQPAFDEVGRFTAATKPSKVKATMKGLSFFSDPGVVTPEAGTCKWKLTRVEVGDAGIATECLATLQRAATLAPDSKTRTRRHAGFRP